MNSNENSDANIDVKKFMKKVLMSKIMKILKLKMMKMMNYENYDDIFVYSLCFECNCTELG